MASAPEPQRVTALIVDDEWALRASLRRLLAAEGFQLLEAADGLQAMALVARSQHLPLPPGVGPAQLPPESVPRIDIIVSDLRMPEANGLELLRYVRANAPHIEVIVLTAYAEVSDAVTALKLGAYNFLEKPFDPEAFLLEVKRAQLIALGRQGKPPAPKAAVEPGPTSLVGSSPPMQALRAVIQRVAASDSTVLLEGESGTGKEVVARALHDASPRAKGPFVAVHCGAIPEHIFESELFGHVKGAFTGALTAREGRFAAAEGGTIFLDELGEMPLLMQVKLLRVLQEKTYEPVGASKSRKGDFRVLAATNRDLARAVAQGTFRQDLYYRLNVVPIHVPPLRERVSDLPELAAHFVEEQNRQKHTQLLPPTPETIALMKRYAWPGNVRELAHLIERISVLKGEGPIQPSDMPSVMQQGSPGIMLPSGAPAEGQPARSMNLNAELTRLEIELIRLALQQSGGNKNRASQILGVNRTTLIEKIKRLGLQQFADSLGE